MLHVEKEDLGDTRTQSRPGASPGIEHLDGIHDVAPSGAIQIRCYDYNKEQVQDFTTDDIDQLLERERPDWGQTRWIHIEGLNAYVVNKIKNHYDLHSLAAEDVMNVPQRPKVECYGKHLFVVARMMNAIDNTILSQQVSMFLIEDTLITIQERDNDVWEPIRNRLKVPGSRIRSLGSPYLLYALLDGIVDFFYPLLEQYGDKLQAMETQALENPTPETQKEIHAVKRQLTSFRRVMWPMREAVNNLYHDETNLLPDEIKTFIRDVYDHAMQVIDIIETYREMASSLNDLYMSAVSNRMNEIMKVLTIIGSFFIPITFIAGVYGMNFENLPELHWKYAYPTFWIACLTVVTTLLIFFKKKKWL